MATRRMYEIDGVKLREELKKRNLTGKQVETECGFGISVINHYIRDNRISKMAVEILRMKYNILFDDYKIDEVKPESPVTEVVQVSSINEDDWKQLYKVIYSATYEAMKRALSE